jgi:hypothetical protein
MIRMEQIPDEVVEAAARALADDAKLNWGDIPYAHNVMRKEARAAIAAALNAWPGGGLIKWPAIFLPLPQKEGDA